MVSGCYDYTGEVIVLSDNFLSFLPFYLSLVILGYLVGNRVTFVIKLSVRSLYMSKAMVNASVDIEMHGLRLLCF